MKNISYNQAMALIAEMNAVLVDVQLEADYGKSHIKGSINIPLEKIGTQMSKYGLDKNKAIIVCCQKGIRSSAAAYILEKLGYENVYNINGGFNG